MSTSRYILLVDDDPDDLMLLREALEVVDASLRVSECKDGRSALNFLREKAVEKDLPCLVVLDINMPILDGREVLAILKSDPELKLIPVVIFTTSTNKTDMEYCAQFNVEMLSKPFNVSILQEMARKMISLCN
jgi:CheY-like chemotaxis protein